LFLISAFPLSFPKLFFNRAKRLWRGIRQLTDRAGNVGNGIVKSYKPYPKLASPSANFYNRADNVGRGICQLTDSISTL